MEIYQRLQFFLGGTWSYGNSGRRSSRFEGCNIGSGNISPRIVGHATDEGNLVTFAVLELVAAATYPVTHLTAPVGPPA